MRAIIIATGEWKRLLPLTELKPVSLLKIDEIPLIEHQLKVLLDSGIKEIVVIAGKFYDQYKRFISSNIILERNPFYESTNILASIWLLKKYLDQPFLLIYDDVYFDESIIKSLLKSSNDDVVLGISNQDVSIEAEKVHLEKTKISSIGKLINNGYHNAEYIGVAYFKKSSLKSLFNIVDKLVSKNIRSRFTDLIQALILEGNEINSVDVKDSLWADIDTPENLQFIRNKLENKNEEKIVFATMCADPIHYGHINMIKQAKKYGDKVVIGLLTDKAVKEYKSPPLMPFKYRKVVVESIKEVDEVIPQDSGLDYTKTLHEVKPDYLVHGDDWIYGRLKETRNKAIETMKIWSGKVIDIQYTEGVCSTDIKKKLKNERK